jgi:hypothetical protein
MPRNDHLLDSVKKRPELWMLRSIQVRRTFTGKSLPSNQMPGLPPAIYSVVVCPEPELSEFVCPEVELPDLCLWGIACLIA